MNPFTAILRVGGQTSSTSHYAVTLAYAKNGRDFTVSLPPGITNLATVRSIMLKLRKNENFQYTDETSAGIFVIHGTKHTVSFTSMHEDMYSISFMCDKSGLSCLFTELHHALECMQDDAATFIQQLSEGELDYEYSLIRFRNW